MTGSRNGKGPFKSEMRDIPSRKKKAVKKCEDGRLCDEGDGPSPALPGEKCCAKCAALREQEAK